MINLINKDELLSYIIAKSTYNDYSVKDLMRDIANFPTASVDITDTDMQDYEVLSNLNNFCMWDVSHYKMVEKEANVCIEALKIRQALRLMKSAHSEPVSDIAVEIIKNKLESGYESNNDKN